ncbi:MAG: glycosyltransferase family 1 protein [Acidimicrobiales bacterium]|nr:glycosyltransferase family 1 protein [Acidimicrobiales bacterium]
MSAETRVETRVGVNLCWLVPGVVGGSEQATVRTLEAIASRGPGRTELVLFCLPAFVDEYPQLASAFETHTAPVSGRCKPLRVLAEYTWLPWMVRRSGVDLLHDAGGTSPGRVEVPRVLTIHDIQPLELPGNFPPVRVEYLRRTLPRAVASARRIVVPSEFVKGTVVEHLGADPDNVSVVPWSRPLMRSDTPIDIVRARWGLTGPFAVLPAITYHHKSHVTAVRAMDHLVGRHPHLRLVLAGGRGPAEQAVLDEIRRLGLERQVVRTGRLPTSSMVSLIEAADVLVFPSTYEGFGIPALEAMTVGTPVVVADAGALREVVADAGVVVPAHDDTQLAAAVHRILVDPEHRAALVAAGHRRSGDFDPERTAEGLLAAYRSAAAGR